MSMSRKPAPISSAPFYLRIIFFAVLFTSVLSSKASAEIVKQAHTEVELIADVRSVRPGSQFRMAVRFKMDPDWHIYWKNPGDSGLAPEIKWQVPEGVSAGTLEWPYPHKIPQPPLMSYGYEGEVFLAVPARVSENFSGTALDFKASVDWLACKVDCIPGKTDLNLTLPVSGQSEPDAQWVEKLVRTRELIPLQSSDWQIQANQPGKEKIVLKIRDPVENGYQLSGLYFYPDDPALIQHAQPQKIRKIESGYELEILLSANGPKELTRLKGVIVTNEGWRGIGSEKGLEADLPVGRIPDTVLPAGEILGFGTALLFAFLGGLILNLMPCVLPILSIKILSFVKQAGEDSRLLFKHGLMFSAGVILSFWILAVFLMVLQAGGAGIGWGFQLQSPYFLTGLIFLFFHFSLNLFGVFEVGMSLAGAGQSWTKQQGMMSSFLSGILATVVATPCTAPFMGTALGFAITQPPFTALAIFTFLGLGMAAPYLLVCSHPAFIRFLPKPGPWMGTLKKFLGILLLATAAWLIWVLNFLTTRETLMVVIGALFLSAVSAWVYGQWGTPASDRKIRGISKAVSLALFLTALTMAFGSVRMGSLETPKGSEETRSRLEWEAYSKERFEELRAQNRLIFIDFTAAWCLTCQVNERVVLNSAKVSQAFKDFGVVVLKADWTSRSSEITEALAGYGRNSIPLYVLYGRDAQKPPVILPEILTKGIVLEALESIRKQDQV